MAKDTKRKIQRSKEQENNRTSVSPQVEQELRVHQTNPQSPVFTPEQRLILGRVYQLILSWRRERKAKEGRVPATNGNSIPQPASQMVPVEVEA